MSLYSKFKDEAEFRETFVKPLLNRLGFYGVSEQHGSQEFGKDFVFSELHRLGGLRHYAAQVKHVEKFTQGKLIDELLSQVRQAFKFRNSLKPRFYSSPGCSLSLFLRRRCHRAKALLCVAVTLSL